MTKEKLCRESRMIQIRRVFPFNSNPFGTPSGGKLMFLIDDTAFTSVLRRRWRGVATASSDNLDSLKPLRKGHLVCVETLVSGVHRKSVEAFAETIGGDLIVGERRLAAICLTTPVAIPPHTNPEGDPQLAAVAPEAAEEKLIHSSYETRR